MSQKDNSIKKAIFDNICKSQKYIDEIEDRVLDYRDSLFDAICIEQPKLGEEIKNKVAAFKKNFIKNLIEAAYKAYKVKNGNKLDLSFDDLNNDKAPIVTQPSSAVVALEKEIQNNQIQKTKPIADESFSDDEPEDLLTKEEYDDLFDMKIN